MQYRTDICPVFLLQALSLAKDLYHNCQAVKNKSFIKMKN